jgi:ribose transport system permease protein
MMKNLLAIFAKFRAASVVLIIVLFSILMSFLSKYYFTWNNLSTTFIGMSADGIMAIGMTMVLASGGIDLSVGAIMGMSGSITGVLYIAGWNVFLACLVAVAVSLIFGLINGVVISKTTISPMICTLATMTMARGVALIVTQGSPKSLSSVPDAFRFLGKGTFFGFPMLIIIFVVIAVFFAFLMNKSALFRKVYYVGSNEQAAEFSGISVFKTKLGVYLLSAGLSSLAGILTISRFLVATPAVGEGTEMTAISVAVIGGASTTGGEGTVTGTVCGLILITLINNALVLLNVSVYWQKLISGSILLLAVLIDYFSHRSKN